MTIEFIGIAATAPHSETEIAASQSDPVQPGYLEELARAHEEAGFDRVLVAHSSASPDGFTVADQVLSRTQRLGVLLAHRPGFVAPTYAARKFATLTGANDLVDGLALRVDAGDETVAGHPAIAKLIATRAAIGTVEQAVALVGNNALTRKNPLERHYRDVLCARVHTPQDDSILTAAGRSALAASRTATTATANTTGAH
jgi:hypothetical protein